MSNPGRCQSQAVAVYRRPRVIALALILVAAALLLGALLVTPALVTSMLGDADFTDSRIATVLGGSKYDASFSSGVIQGTLQDLRLLAATLGVLSALLGLALLVWPVQVARLRDWLVHRLGRLNPRRTDYAFCAAISIVAFIVTLVATRNGPGMDPDSIVYIAAGRGLFMGEGFGDLVRWPPGYPLLIAGMMHLGMAAEQAARLVVALSLALSVYPLCVLGRILGGRLAGYLSCLIPLAMWPLALVSVYAWSEMPYILFSLCVVLCLTVLAIGRHDRQRLRILGAAAALAGMAALTRYIGISLVVTGGLLLLFNSRVELRRRMAEAIAFCGLAALPAGAWVIRNLATTGTPAGERPASTAGLAHNAVATVRRIAYDFTSGDAIGSLWPPGAVVAVAVVGVLIAVMVVCALKGDPERRLLRGYLHRASPVMWYAVVYLATLIGIASLWSFLPIYVRFLTPVYPFLALLLISFGSFFVSGMRAGPFRGVLIGVFAAVLLLLAALQLPCTLLIQNGAQQGYSYASPFWRNAESIDWAQRNLPDDAVVFTNDVYALRLTLPDTQLERLPGDIVDDTARVDSYRQVAATPSGFALVFKEHAASSKRRNTHSDFVRMNEEHGLLVLVVDFPEATIWKAGPT